MDARDTRAAQAFLVHHAFVRSVAIRNAPWPGLAEDIVQQVFLEFLGKEERWDLERDLRPLLTTMTRHVALRLWRERTRQMPENIQKLADHVRQLAEERDGAAAHESDEDQLAALRGCLAKLPDKSRSLVERYYFEELSAQDIADQLQMKSDTVCRALCRVREKLRACLGKNPVSSPA
jgi:RNA polymerase sigma-70 factor (ECF subfamily)